MLVAIRRGSGWRVDGYSNFIHYVKLDDIEAVIEGTRTEPDASD